MAGFRRLISFGFLGLMALAQRTAPGGQYPASLLLGLTWRDVGPMRGGRSFGVAGHADQPDTFYFGSVGGGVWKTENAGRTWYPIADEGIPIGSIGAIAVAPSDANVVYVGTGESDIRSQHSYGIGMFKSTDAGKTWKRIGLEGTRQIGRVVVDPLNANRVYVAALGHVYDANPDRGVFRSLDGGATWKKVLFDTAAPNDVGAVDMAVDPKNPRVLYASLWGTRRPPWSVYAPSNLPGGGLYKSIDGGDTWKKLAGGLPNDNFVGRIGIAVSPSNPNRLWAVVDDRGQRRSGGQRCGARRWRRENRRRRLSFGRRGRDLEAGELRESPVGARLVLRIGGGRSRQSGSRLRHQHRDLYDYGCRQNLRPVKGAPGGDDYHQLWINPKDGNRMVLSSDQGTVVSVDGAKTWSTWYNQPTAQIYHVAADNRFPYWLYGAQQDSGGVGVSTLSREGVLSISVTGSPPARRAKAHGRAGSRRTATCCMATATGAAIRS